MSPIARMTCRNWLLLVDFCSRTKCLWGVLPDPTAQGSSTTCRAVRRRQVDSSTSMSARRATGPRPNLLPPVAWAVDPFQRRERIPLTSRHLSVGRLSNACVGQSAGVTAASGRGSAKQCCAWIAGGLQPLPLRQRALESSVVSEWPQRLDRKRLQHNISHHQ